MMHLKLEVLTPEKEALSREVHSVYLEGSQGRLGILPGHTTLISKLSFGILEYETSRGKTTLLCGGGLVEVHEDRVVVLVRSAEDTDEIDVDRAKAALNRAKSRRDSKDAEVDMTRAEAALQRSLERLRFKGTMR